MIEGLIAMDCTRCMNITIVTLLLLQVMPMN